MSLSFGPPACPSIPKPTTRWSSTASARPGRATPADFQVTPSGNDAVFTSTLPLTGYDNGRPTARSFAMTPPAASNAPRATRPTSRRPARRRCPPNGLGISNDGRVFFNSTEGLVDRDLNEKEDAYQWEPEGFEFGHGASHPAKLGAAASQLISTGASPFASSLLGISADGTDAYFFTRDNSPNKTKTATRSRSTTPARSAASPRPAAPAVQSLG